LAKRVTVIDIGSNSIRMVVFEKTSRFAFHILYETKSKVRISENAYQNDSNLQEIPMQRAFYALKDFLSISQSFQSRKTLCVATSALRDAPNKKDFTQKVKQKLKLNIKIINGEKEAYYGALACANLLPEQNNSLSIDIGGGSTEFSIINKKDISHTVSLALGTVRLKELFFDTNKLEEATIFIDKKLEFLKDIDASTLIGIGGTFRAISTAIMQNSQYPLNNIHAYKYSITTLKTFISNILKADNKELKKLGIDSNRFDIIKPGALILSRIIKKLSIKDIVTSGVGVREGVYLSDMLRTSNAKMPNNYNTSVRYLLDAHIKNSHFSNNLNILSKKLFDLTYEYLNIKKKYRYELSIASKLYPIGSNIHFYSKNRHSYYIIQSALEYGFTHENTVLIATLTRYAKRKFPSSEHVEKYKNLLPDRDTLNSLSYLISLALTLLSHRPRNIDFDLEFKDGTLNIISKEEMYLSKNATKKS